LGGLLRQSYHLEHGMRLVSFILAGMLGGLGLLFLIGNQGLAGRLLLGGLLIVIALALLVILRLQPRVEKHFIQQKVELSGDMRLQDLKCQACSAPLSRDNLIVRAGALFVDCHHCRATYQFEEAPKW